MRHRLSEDAVQAAHPDAPASNRVGLRSEATGLFACERASGLHPHAAQRSLGVAHTQDVLQGCDGLSGGMVRMRAHRAPANGVAGGLELGALPAVLPHPPPCGGRRKRARSPQLLCASALVRRLVGQAPGLGASRNGARWPYARDGLNTPACCVPSAEGCAVQQSARACPLASSPLKAVCPSAAPQLAMRVFASEDQGSAGSD